MLFLVKSLKRQISIWSSKVLVSYLLDKIKKTLRKKNRISWSLKIYF